MQHTLFSLLLMLAGCGLAPPPAEPLMPVPVAPAVAQSEKPPCRPAEHALKRGPIPFAEGAALSGWTIDEVQADHIEFVRIFLEKGSDATGIEVRYQEGEADEWSTEQYRLMPAPALEPPEELLKAVMVVLRGVEGEPFVRRVDGEGDPWAGLPDCEG